MGTPATQAARTALLTLRHMETLVWKTASHPGPPTWGDTHALTFAANKPGTQGAQAEGSLHGGLAAHPCLPG